MISGLLFLRSIPEDTQALFRFVLETETAATKERLYRHKNPKQDNETCGVPPRIIQGKSGGGGALNLGKHDSCGEIC